MAILDFFRRFAASRGDRSIHRARAAWARRALMQRLDLRIAQARDCAPSGAYR